MNLQDRNFITSLYNDIREESTNLSNRRTFNSLTEKEEGYMECLEDLSRSIREYMHKPQNKRRFYSL